MSVQPRLIRINETERVLNQGYLSQYEFDSIIQEVLTEDAPINFERIEELQTESDNFFKYAFAVLATRYGMPLGQESVAAIKAHPCYEDDLEELYFLFTMGLYMGMTMGTCATMNYLSMSPSSS